MSVFIHGRDIKACLSGSASPVDLAGLVPTSVLSIWCVVSVLALEVNKGEEEEKSMKGSTCTNWISSIFPVFTYNYHIAIICHLYCMCRTASSEAKDCISLSRECNKLTCFSISQPRIWPMVFVLCVLLLFRMSWGWLHKDPSPCSSPLSPLHASRWACFQLQTDNRRGVLYTTGL